LSQKATLYSGPGNVAYDSLADLLAGTTVYPLGTYADFVKVAVVIPEKGGPAEVTGFVWRNMLEDLPGDLPVLTGDQVPLVSFFLPSCSPGTYDPSIDTITFADTSNISYASMKWTLEDPVRIQIRSFTSTHDWNLIGLGGASSPGGTSLDIMSQQGYRGNYVLAIPQGNEQYYMIDLGRGSSLPLQLQFNDVQGRTFDVLDENNHLLKTVDLTHTADGHDLLPDGLFPDGQLAFGFNIHENSRLTVSGFRLGIQPTGRWVNQPDISDYINSPGLYRVAEGKNLTIGANILFDRMIDRRYCQIMQHDFNLATLTEFSYKPLWLGPGNYDWGRMDRPVDLAIQHGWRVRAAHLAYGEVWNLPDWLLTTNYSPEKYKEILKEQIHMVMSHFKGKVQEWSLANELAERIFCPPDLPHPTKDFWFEKIYGSTGNYTQDYNNYLDYLRMVFGWARAEDPDATLILNDAWDYPPYNICTNVTIRSMHDAVEALNQPGHPKLIDAIGMQMHLDVTNSPSKGDLIHAMQYLASAGPGVKVYITEMDVNLTSLVAGHPDRNERWETEASIFKNVMDACLESGVCGSFSQWDLYDAISWLTLTCSPGCANQPESDPTLFDRDFMPKPAYFALRDALIKSTIATATPTP
jgi:endo-1,4-beta-xylanase